MATDAAIRKGIMAYIHNNMSFANSLSLSLCFCYTHFDDCVRRGEIDHDAARGVKRLIAVPCAQLAHDPVTFGNGLFGHKGHADLAIVKQVVDQRQRHDRRELVQNGKCGQVRCRLVPELLGVLAPSSCWLLLLRKRSRGHEPACLDQSQHQNKKSFVCHRPKSNFFYYLLRMVPDK